MDEKKVKATYNLELREYMLSQNLSVRLLEVCSWTTQHDMSFLAIK